MDTSDLVDRIAEQLGNQNVRKNKLRIRPAPRIVGSFLDTALQIEIIFSLPTPADDAMYQSVKFIFRDDPKEKIPLRLCGLGANGDLSVYVFSLCPTKAPSDFLKTKGMLLLKGWLAFISPKRSSQF